MPMYVAVGRALSKWETLEATLSYKYSIFEGKPIDYDLLEFSGQEGRTFKDRMAMFKRSAEKNFQLHPSQSEEGRIETFIAEAIRLSIFRYQVAHGILVGREDYSGRAQYVLVPPSRGFFHLTKRDRHYYRYGSAAIDAFSNSFIVLARSVQAFNHERHPPT